MMVERSKYFESSLTSSEKSWFILLAVSFSYIGSQYLLNFGGNFFPEFLILPWLILSVLILSPKTKKLGRFIWNKTFLMLIFSVFAITLIGLFREEADILNYYARTRALLLFLIVAYAGYYAQKHNDHERYLEILFWISLSAVLLNFGNTIISTISIGNSVKSPFSIFAYLIVIGFLVRKNNMLGALIFVFLLVINSFLSFFRQNYILAILVVLYFLFILIKSTSSSIKQKLIVVNTIAIVIVFIAFSSFNIEAMLMDFLNSSESRYIQSIGKLNEMMNSIEGSQLGESENIRLLGIEYMISNLNYYFLPNGLVNDSVFEIYSIWGGEAHNIVGVSIVRDSMFAYFVICFGYIIVIPIMIFGMVLTIRFLFGSGNKEARKRVILFSTIFWFMFFMDGASITQFEKAFFTGAIIPLAFPRSRRVAI